MAETTGPSKTTGEMQPTLGLTGLTMNAMALIAPGAFLWLTFFSQAGEGATAPAMWSGILMATLLCLATAVCYAELAKLYPVPAALITSPSNRSSIMTSTGGMRGSRSSSWAGPRICITGYIPA